jgi:hypothetical protein
LYSVGADEAPPVRGARNDAGTPVGQSVQRFDRSATRVQPQPEGTEMNHEELGKPFKYSAIVGVVALAVTAVISLFN